LLLRVLSTARAKIKTVGAVYGPRSTPAARAAREAAERLGLQLLATEVSSGPQAVRALHALVGKIDAIWLPGDTDVITPQVFQYALRLQLEYGTPVAAATRQQVHSGALMAVDFAPRAAGRAAADLANRYLDGDRPDARDEIDLYGGARISVNAQVARRMGVDTHALETMGAKIE
jgi:putative ABC transport system substrate-binding protein